MNSQASRTVIFHVDSDGLAVLRINRLQARNALDWEGQDRFAACIKSIKSDKRVRALIITGSGNNAFVSGGDLKEFLHNHDTQSGHRLNRVMSEALAVFAEKRPPVFNQSRILE
jgi:enoyl-CoA hydratase